MQMSKLADFGLAARVKDGEVIRGDIGTVPYMACEMVRGETYGHAVDVWSLGEKDKCLPICIYIERERRVWIYM